MSWSAAKKSDFTALVSFLCEREHRCVSLTSRLLFARNDPFFDRKPFILLNKNRGGKVTGVLYFSSVGTILPVFSRATTMSDDDLAAIAAFSKRFYRRLHSIIGTAQDVVKTETILSAKPVTKNSYILMSKETADFPSHIPSPPPDITIRKAESRDARKLYPLQKNYEIEEVLVHPDRFNPGGCMNHLRYNLSRHITFCAEEKKNIIAKGGTNGIGFSYYQLGGIYTLPEYRNKGISTALVIRLFSEITSLGKKACLFVKTENAPALRVYHKLGFDIRENFSVSYFF